MRRTFVALALGLVVPGLAIAHPHSHAVRTHSDDTLGWAVVRDGHKHSSSVDDEDDIRSLVDRYGDDFLYVRDGKERYVIRDSKMIDRAEDASHEIGEHVREITTVAHAQARVALNGAAGARAQAKLARREAKLEMRIDRAERDGEDTKELERELEQVREDLEDLEAHREKDHLSESERRDLEHRRDKANDGLEKAVDHLRAEIRVILRESKEKGLAERVR